MSQTSFRLPPDLARALDRLARERGVPKSQLVREALARYLAAPEASSRVMAVRERSAPYIGAIRLDAPGRGDAVGALIRERNWRE